MKNYFYMVRGLPGSGKTTFANDIAELHRKHGHRVFVIAADDYFYNEEGMYEFDRDKLYHAHQDCQARTNNAIWFPCTTPKVIIIHNTSTTEKELRPYFEMIAASNQEWVVRSLVVENRHGNKSVHGVPDHTLEAMRNRFSLKL